MISKKYKIIENFPQARVRLIHYILVDNERQLEDIKLNLSDYAFETETDIDFGGEAFTEEIIEAE